jgi:Tol biopolymer transport system component
MRTKMLIGILVATFILVACGQESTVAPTETAIPTVIPSPTQTALSSPTATVLSVPMSQSDLLTSVPKGLIIIQGCYRTSDIDTGPCPNSVWLYDKFGSSKRLPFPESGWEFDLSHDYKRGVYEAGGDIWLLDFSTGENKNITNTVDCYEENPTWSPDDTNVAFLGCKVDSPRDVFILDITSRKVMNVTNTQDRYETCFLTNMYPPYADCKLAWWSQQPKLIFAGSGKPKTPQLGEALRGHCHTFGGECFLYPTEITIDGSSYKILNELSGLEHEPALSPDGKLLAYDGGNLFNLETGEQEVIFPSAYGLGVEASDKAGNPQLVMPKWSPDGKQIAWIGHLNNHGDNGVYVFNISSHEGQILHTYSPYYATLTLPAWQRWSNAVITWSPDSQWVTLSDSEYNEKSNNPITKENTFLWLFSRDGNIKVRIDNCVLNIGVPIWSTDSQKVVFSRRCIANGVPQTIQMFDINTLELRQIDAPGNSYPMGWLQP